MRSTLGTIATPALALVTLASCGPRSLETTPEPSAGWIEGPTPNVRTLLVEPVALGSLQAPGRDGARLEVGAFFARYLRSDGPLDQLALMVRVVGPGTKALLDHSRQILFEVDGELFVGEPGVSDNSFRVEHAEGVGRAEMVIPVTPSDLHRLAEATEVRGRLGLWASFDFPPAARARLASLLTRLPPGAPVGLENRPLFTRLASRALD